MPSPWSGENSGTWSVENSETCLPCYLCAEVKIELAGMQKHPRHIHGQGFLMNPNDVWAFTSILTDILRIDVIACFFLIPRIFLPVSLNCEDMRQ